MCWKSAQNECVEFLCEEHTSQLSLLGYLGVIGREVGGEKDTGNRIELCLFWLGSSRGEGRTVPLLSYLPYHGTAHICSHDGMSRGEQKMSGAAPISIIGLEAFRTAQGRWPTGVVDRSNCDKKSKRMHALKAVPNYCHVTSTGGMLGTAPSSGLAGPARAWKLKAAVVSG